MLDYEMARPQETYMANAKVRDQIAERLLRLFGPVAREIASELLAESTRHITHEIKLRHSGLPIADIGIHVYKRER
jgi:ubiquinone biosynthesis protein UbiJ